MPGFVQARRDGRRGLYRLGNGPVLTLLSAPRQYAVFNIPLAELERRLASGFEEWQAPGRISKTGAGLNAFVVRGYV